MYLLNVGLFWNTRFCHIFACVIIPSFCRKVMTKTFVCRKVIRFYSTVRPSPFPNNPLHRSWLYIHICSALWNNRQILRRSDGQMAWGITEHFFFGDKMTKSGGLVRLLTSRSQHVSLLHLELSEVTKGTLVVFNLSAFSAIERLPLPLSARIQNIKKKNISLYV